jgi:endonuclease/exonuclease/phosphatase family metal-dependent hydrolase
VRSKLSPDTPDSVRFTTYNVLNLFEDDSARQREHYKLVVEVIREVDPDVLAVQEILAPDQRTAQNRLRRLADDVGMQCQVPARPTAQPAARTARGPASRPASRLATRPVTRPALAPGAHGYHLGLMWRDGITPVPGSLRCYGAGYFWHSLAVVSLEAHGSVLRYAAHHAAPFGRLARAADNERLVGLLAVRALAPPVVVGADWNTESADRVRDPGSGTWTLYEPADPFAGAEWFDQLVHQCTWDYSDVGARRHRADRLPGEVLWAGGLYDAAAALRAPWQATTGHYDGDAFGARGIRRRIDGFRVSRELIPALRAHHVTDSELARRASDHLPVTVEFLPSAVSGQPGVTLPVPPDGATG